MADVSTYKVYGTLPTIPEEQVQKLVEQSESGALPEVTAADNGKVLTVVNGEWDKANSGGGGVLIVNLTANEDEYLVCDKTAEEIFSSIQIGGAVTKRTNSETGEVAIANFTSISKDEYGYVFYTSSDMVFYALTDQDYPTTEEPSE